MDSSLRTGSRPRVAVTLGDPSGIGPEVAAKALADCAADVEAVVFGNSMAWARGCEVAGARPRVELVATDETPLSALPFGAGSAESGRSAVAALARATDELLAGRVDGLCTAPLSKSAVQLTQPSFVGHTEYLQQRFGLARVVMLMAGERLKVALVTTHVAISELPRAVTRPAIVETLEITARELRERFGLAEPHLAVCGLNPHAGEAGHFGDEEARVIEPAIAEARRRGILADGPFAADGIFPRASELGYQAVVAMYHDQGLVAFKLTEFHAGVNVTLGLPRPRTSPDHGTAWDLAGKGLADPRSMASALGLCAQLARRDHRPR